MSAAERGALPNAQRVVAGGFLSFEVWILNLFRISDFEFRVCHAALT